MLEDVQCADKDMYMCVCAKRAQANVDAFVGSHVSTVAFERPT